MKLLRFWLLVAATIVWLSAIYTPVRVRAQEPPPSSEHNSTSVFFSLNGQEVIPHPGSVIDIDGQARSQANIPEPGSYTDVVDGVVVNIIRRVQTFVSNILRPKIYAPSSRFRGAVEMIIDAILTREIAPYKSVITQITKESLDFALPTNEGETTKYIAQLNVVRKIGKDLAVFILTLSLAMISLITLAKLTSGAPIDLIPFRNWFFVTLFALNADQIVYFVNDFIGQFGQILCQGHACSSPENVVAYLFPDRKLDLIPDLTRVIAVAIFTVGILVSFISRWLLLNIIVWLAPIAIASLSLPVVSTVGQYWISSYGRLALAYLSTLGFFIIAEKTTLLSFSTPVFNIALAIVFATVLMAINGLATLNAIVGLKDFAFSSVAAIASSATVVGESFSQIPRMLKQEALSTGAGILSQPGKVVSTTWQVMRKSHRHQYNYTPMVLDEADPSYMGSGYFMQRQREMRNDSPSASMIALPLILGLLVSVFASPTQPAHAFDTDSQQKFLAANLNIRKAPSKNSEIVATLPCGTQVTAGSKASEDEDWRTIKSPVAGFAADKFLLDAPSEDCPPLAVAYPSKTPIRLYAAPSITSTVVAAILCPQFVIIQDYPQNPDWKVARYPRPGFVLAESLASDVCEPVSIKAFVVATTLNVRQAPSTSAPVIGRLPCSTEITVHGRTEDAQWLAISSPVSGFVSARWVDSSATSCFIPPVPYFLVEINSPSFRTAPSYESLPIWVSNEVVKVAVTGRTHDNWLQAYLFGRYLYIEPTSKIVSITRPH